MERTDKPTRAERPGRVFTVVVLALLVVLILSAIFIPLGVYRSRGEVIVSYGAVTVRRDLYVYWLSAYKYSYLSDQTRLDPSVSDTPEYWAGDAGTGRTRAEEVRAQADAWIKRIVLASSLFENEDQALGRVTLGQLEGAYDRLLQYELDTERAFDRAAKKVGFRYSTVRRALFYQTEGESYVGPMTDSEFDSFCSLADDVVTIRAAAEKIDFISLPTDARLYAEAFLP